MLIYEVRKKKCVPVKRYSGEIADFLHGDIHYLATSIATQGLIQSKREYYTDQSDNKTNHLSWGRCLTAIWAFNGILFGMKHYDIVDHEKEDWMQNKHNNIDKKAEMSKSKHVAV